MNPPVLKHPGRWLWLVLLVPVVLGLARLRFDVEVFDLLPSDLTVVQGLKLYQQYFANSRELIVALAGSEGAQTESAARAVAERLAQATNLVATVTWEPPWLAQPGLAAEFLAYLWFNQPPEIFGKLTNHLASTNLAATFTAAREELATSFSPQEMARLSYDPLGFTRLPEDSLSKGSGGQPGGASPMPGFAEGQEMFGSQDGKFRIVFVQANKELITYKECDEWVKAIQALVGPAAASAGLSASQIGYTGRPAFVAETALGMEHDITISVGGTAAIIALLFWLAHKRVKPMLWLLTLLAVILGCTLALGGLIFGKINVVSMGFAAILLGLAVDYAVVHYQEALAHPQLSIPEIRHAIAPSIFWAAVTTITAFLVLNFGGLPGLGQLGTLVGLGVALAAFIMIFEFLPPLFPERRQPKSNTAELTEIPARPLPEDRRAKIVFRVTAIALLASAGLLVFGLPRIDPTANALRPSHSQAYATLEQIQAHLIRKKEPVWLIAGGWTEMDVARRLVEIQGVLARAASNHLIAEFTLPTVLWPRLDFQTANKPIARQLASQRGKLRQAALENGFAESSLGLTEGVLDTWQRASQAEGVFWPSNRMSQWIFQKLATRSGSNLFALGLIDPGVSGEQARANLHRLETELPGENVWLSGWELLGHAIFSRVKANMWKVLAPMILLVLLSLWLAFQRLGEVLLSLAVLLSSGLCLLAAMRLAGWSWNLLNLMGIPLILGTGVDYSIFMQLALRRHKGDLPMAYRSVGRALLLCGGTAVAGFGSLALSSNAGMSSLGKICAVGIGSNMLIAIFVLPIWWRKVVCRSGSTCGTGPNEKS